MADVTSALGPAGPGELFESGGKVYSLAHITPGVRARFSAWCKQRARRLITESREYLTAEEYAEDLDAFRAAKEAGRYNWGSPLEEKAMGDAVHNILGTPEGNVQMLALLLEPAHGVLTPQQVLEILKGADADEVQDALGEALRVLPPNGVPPGKKEMTPGARRRRQRRAEMEAALAAQRGAA